ncbi:MAG: methyl-accepting chemotaxis protein, partial [Planctomycetota bacterium]
MLSFIGRLKLGTKISIVAVALLVVVVSVSYAVFVMGYQSDAQKAMVSKSSAFTAVADQAKAHQSALIQSGAVDMPTLLEEAIRVKESGGDVRETRLFEAIPVVVGWTTAGNAARDEGLDFKVVAFDARNPENTPEPGGFRESLLRDLETQVRAGDGKQLSRINTATNSMHYVRAIELDASCMVCHGDPEVYDEDGDGLDPLGFAMEGWAPGDTHGAYEVVTPLAQLDAQVAGFVGQGMMVAIPVGVLGIVGLVIALRAMLSRPLTQLGQALIEIADGDGDLTKRLDEKRSDEIGTVARGFNRFATRIHDVVSAVSGATNETAAASEEITAQNEEMSSSLATQRGQVEQLAAAAEQMSASVGDVAQTAADASGAAERAGSSAQTGEKSVGNTVEGMNQIAGAVNETSQAIEQLGALGA